MRVACAGWGLGVVALVTSCHGSSSHPAPSASEPDAGHGELAKAPSWLSHIVVADDEVFFTSDGDEKNLAGVYALPTAGGAPRVVARWKGGAPEIAVRDGYVFVADVSEGWVGRVPRSGGRIIDVAADFATVTAPAADGTSVYFVGDGSLIGTDRSGGSPKLLLLGSGAIVATAVDDAFVYSLDASAGSVMKTPKAGGPSDMLAASPAPSLVVLAGDDVVWFSNGTPPSNQGAILAVPRSGGATRELVSPALFVRGLAADDTHVYWAGEYPGGGVFKAPLAGGPPVKLVATANATAVAVDGLSVYYNDVFEATLWKVAK